MRDPVRNCQIVLADDRACGEVATTTREAQGKTIHLCGIHAAEWDINLADAGAITIQEWS